MMTLYEFTVFGIYLAVLTILMIAIQIVNPGNQRYEAPEEKRIDDSVDVSDSEEESLPFNPETEPFNMTENPMFSHIESKED